MKIAICFGGRVAENRIISKDNTGASQDLEQANALIFTSAQQMLCTFLIIT